MGATVSDKDLTVFGIFLEQGSRPKLESGSTIIHWLVIRLCERRRFYHKNSLLPMNFRKFQKRESWQLGPALSHSSPVLN